MIYPIDEQDRLQKQHKTRVYKAMLDEQIRDNNLYSQIKVKDRRRNRVRTQPYQRSVDQSYSRQIPHQSTFLPSIQTSKPSYLAPTREFSRDFPRVIHRRHNSNNYLSKYTNPHMIDQSDMQIDRCLQQCQQIINGLNKNFNKIRHHIKPYESRKKNIQLRQMPNSLNLNYMQSNGYNPSNQDRNYSSIIPKKRSLDLNNTNRNSSFRNNNSEFYQNDQQQNNPHNNKYTKLSPITHDKINLSNNKNNLSNKKSSRSQIRQFDTINSNAEPNQFMTNSRKNNQQNQFNDDNDDQKKQMTERQKQKNKQHQESRIKDMHVLEHLKKAKTKGSLLFKKIQLFRKQRENLNKTVKKEHEDDNEQQPRKNDSKMEKEHPIKNQSDQKNINNAKTETQKQQISPQKVNVIQKRNTDSKLSNKSNISKTSKK